MKPTKSSKRPTVRWDQYKRQVLCCLYRFFICDKKETEEIFSYVFRGHLDERGIQGFVPFATLKTQWTWMKNKQDPVWCHVHINTPSATDPEWKEIISKIKSAAKTLRFQLREKTEDDTNTSHWSSLGSDERNIASNGPVLLLPQTLSTPQTLKNDTRNNIPDAHRSTEPVVTSRGKLCLWCKHEGTTYEFEDIQEPQDEDNDYGNGYEDNSHANPHNDRQEDPSMREYTLGFKQFMGELEGKVLYSDKELFGSGSEDYVVTFQGSPPKLRPFCNPDLSLPSGLEKEKEPLGTEDSLNRSTDRGSLANLTVLEPPSIPMEDQSGTLDDDQISTQETLYNIRFPQTRAASTARGRRGMNGSPTMK
ncbi:hypothetical protein N7491_002148 [Penicillium cf. griseofulvum]|uniref:Uncharacterized protein n=1 Tax=Penicillium cf. griseofulvum TaxID=2972120 RepID=A0A9W9MTH1_9EURO|nr:hypothetical protein N7472_003670 [Penicillium cf. griseofulvum]KAJ5446066.1 hypothetical protein N7491_002148 [Penicillium cf. griseofulvum]KAJ5447806.1 hypothetical protein N7445_002627 [Penicillium cf. griseofulvum]